MNGSVILCHLCFTCGGMVIGWTGGLGWGMHWWVAGLVGDDCLDHHFRFEGARADVGVSDGRLPGDEGPTCIPKVPVEGDVCVAEVLAGVVEGDSEGDRPVLDEAHVGRLYVIDLVQRDSKGDLI